MDLQEHRGTVAGICAILSFVISALYDPEAPNGLVYGLSIIFLMIFIVSSFSWLVNRKKKLYAKVLAAMDSLGMDIEYCTGFLRFALSADFKIAGIIDGTYITIESFYLPPPTSTVGAVGGNNSYRVWQ